MDMISYWEISSLGQFFLAENMKLYTIHFDPWIQPKAGEGNINVSNVYHHLMDNTPLTCDDIPDREFINVIWGLPGNIARYQFRVYMKGPQQCRDVNALWLLNPVKSGSNAVECNVTQQNDADLLVCNIQCMCPCGVPCNYLHFHMQCPPWMKKTLALCFYEQLL